MRNHKYYVTVVGIRPNNNIFFSDYVVRKDFKTEEVIDDFIKQVKEEHNLQSCFILNVIKLKR